LKETRSLDTHLQSMRQEGLEFHDISIFVEEKTEYIHSRISLRPLLAGIEHAAKMSTTFGSRANTTLGRILNRKIQRRVDRTESKITHLVPKQNRKSLKSKRSIEFIGNLISKLFGNPGPEDWKQNKRNVLAMKAAIEKQMTNSAILHRDIDQNRHAINIQNEILRHATKIIANNENRLSNVDNELNELEVYLDLEIMIDSIDEILDALNDIKHDARAGRCNEKGLNQDFLIDHLREIESNKNNIAPIFASWEWQNYYSYEMCSLAVHNDEVWLTLRIPIVNEVEQFVRAVPLSNQLWIKQSFATFGYETEFFRQKNLDTFMVVTKSNLDTCSKLGSIRVCNIRKTRFRDVDPCFVPLDISFNRVLIIANSSNHNLELKSVCGQSATLLNITSHTILRIPDECSLMAKFFEISKIASVRNVSTIEKVGKIEYKRLSFANKNDSSAKFQGIDNLSTLDDEFLVNANKTRDELDKINYDDKWSNNVWMMTTSGSSTIVLIVAIAVFLIYKCARSRSGVSKVKIEIEKKDDIESPATEFPAPADDEENVDNSVNNVNEGTTRPRCQFNR
jgi:hypothetical protein